MTIVKDVNENGDAGESSESSSSEESDSDSIEQDQVSCLCFNHSSYTQLCG